MNLFMALFLENDISLKSRSLRNNNIPNLIFSIYIVIACVDLNLSSLKYINNNVIYILSIFGCFARKQRLECKIWMKSF